MSFRVEPAALDVYAAQLKYASEDAEECRRYLEREVRDTGPGVEGGVFNPLYWEHTEVREIVCKIYKHMVTVLSEANIELAAAATAYQHTDREAAASVDASYPTVARPSRTKD